VWKDTEPYLGVVEALVDYGASPFIPRRSSDNLPELVRKLLQKKAGEGYKRYILTKLRAIRNKPRNDGAPSIQVTEKASLVQAVLEWVVCEMNIDNFRGVQEMMGPPRLWYPETEGASRAVFVNASYGLHRV
jgi:hypothetical protein